MSDIEKREVSDPQRILYLMKEDGILLDIMQVCSLRVYPGMLRLDLHAQKWLKADHATKRAISRHPLGKWLVREDVDAVRRSLDVIKSEKVDLLVE